MTFFNNWTNHFCKRPDLLTMGGEVGSQLVDQPVSSSREQAIRNLHSHQLINALEEVQPCRWATFYFAAQARNGHVDHAIGYVQLTLRLGQRGFGSDQTCFMLVVGFQSARGWTATT